MLILRRWAEGLVTDWQGIAKGLVSILRGWLKLRDAFVWVFGQVARDRSVSTLALYNIRAGAAAGAAGAEFREASLEQHSVTFAYFCCSRPPWGCCRC